MSIDEIKVIGVVGAGTMGRDIAYVAASAGYKTILFDPNGEVLHDALEHIGHIAGRSVAKNIITEDQEKVLTRNIIPVHTIREVRADVIIEAVPERTEIKQKIFEELEVVNTPHAVFASNTSSIPIAQITSKLKNPSRMGGLHFFNPAYAMKLVEVISGVSTAPKVTELLVKLAERLGKTPVRVKDTPGFIVNRIARSYYTEALKLFEERVAEVPTIDRLMESSHFRMGPFRLMDLIGIDINFSVTSSLFEAFFYESRFRPSLTQKQKIDAGHLGKKTGNGFYDYSSS